MTPEERELLLQDLSARLPYGVICLVEFSDDRKYAAKLTSVSVTSLGFGSSGVAYLHCCKPYLRPMSSMTEEEDHEFALLQVQGGIDECKYLYACDAANMITWLNRHHFDYCNLIEKGLALPALEGMYKTK